MGESYTTPEKATSPVVKARQQWANRPRGRPAKASDDGSNTLRTIGAELIAGLVGAFRDPGTKSADRIKIGLTLQKMRDQQEARVPPVSDTMAKQFLEALLDYLKRSEEQEKDAAWLKHAISVTPEQSNSTVSG